MAEDFLGLSGKVGIVTGGNSGIGLAIAQRLAESGASVLIAGRRSQQNDEAVAAIERAGGRAIAVACDASEEQAANSLVELAVKEFGRLDICVASAGGIGGGTAPLVEMETSVWRKTVALNLDGVFFLYRAAARQMIKGGSGGSLIGISSIGSIRAVPSVHYAASKGALNAMTMNLAGQLGASGIRVNAILPGFIETPATGPLLTSETITEVIVRRTPVGRIGVPNDIADLACYLASDRSSFITGQQFLVDGGIGHTLLAEGLPKKAS